MISVTRPGGSGFFSLTYQGQRLAYLREDPKEQIVITNKGPIPGPSKFVFYEMWNLALWQHLGISGIKLLNGLQNAIDHGDLELTRVIKDPAGTLRSYSYSLKGCQIQELIEEAKVVAAGGIEIGRHIRFSPPPAQLGVFVTQDPDVKKEKEPELKPPDLSAPIYALRSFHLDKGRLKSLYRDFWWDEGKAIAKCSKEHEVPTSGCSCGLYGLQSLDRLVREYGKECNRCVAVFAAEGRTIVGDRGLKTKAARVVAYWVQTKTELDVMLKEVPKAKHYEDMAQMLHDFHFPAWGTVESLHSYFLLDPPDLEVTAQRWKYSPECRPPTGEDSFLPAAGKSPNRPATGLIASNFKFTVSDVQSAMGSAATPGGLAAIQHVYDIVHGKKKS